MGNMSYCRFRNTLPDFRDCVDNIADDFDNMSDEEKAAAKRIRALCDVYIDRYDFIAPDPTPTDKEGV